MKVAKARIDAVEFTCPECHETIPAPGGSLYWTATEVNVKILTCPSCGKESKVPKRISSTLV